MGDIHIYGYARNPFFWNSTGRWLLMCESKHIERQLLFLGDTYIYIYTHTHLIYWWYTIRIQTVKIMYCWYILFYLFLGDDAKRAENTCLPNKLVQPLTGYGGFLSHGGTPCSSSISNDGIFNDQPYPDIGVAPWLWKPIFIIYFFEPWLPVRKLLKNLTGHKTGITKPKVLHLWWETDDQNHYVYLDKSVHATR